MPEIVEHIGRGVVPAFGPHFGLGWFGPFMSLLVVAVLVAGAIIIVRILATRGQSGALGPRGPIQIVEERFARGEIDLDEFRARRDALRS